MFAYKHSPAGPFQSANDFQRFLPAAYVKLGHRLVQHEQQRFHNQLSGDTCPILLPHGEAVNGEMQRSVQAHGCQGLFDP